MLSSTAHDLLVIASLQTNNFSLKTLQTITSYTSSEIEDFAKTVLQQNCVVNSSKHLEFNY
jgi:hypothetical protein